MPIPEVIAPREQTEIPIRFPTQLSSLRQRGPDWAQHRKGRLSHANLSHANLSHGMPGDSDVQTQPCPPELGMFRSAPRPGV